MALIAGTLLSFGTYVGYKRQREDNRYGERNDLFHLATLKLLAALIAPKTAAALFRHS